MPDMTPDELARVGLRVKHLKRGGTYIVLGVGKVQTDTPLTDYAEVVTYRSEADGAIWTRPVSEFTDGRFAALTPASVAPDVAGLIEAAERQAEHHRVNGTMLRSADLLCELAAALRAQTADAGAQPQDGNRPLPIDRETLGRMVREAWVRWAETQPAPKPSWLVPYDELAEPDKEADRQIGEAIARWTLIHDAARNSLTADAGAQGEEVAPWRMALENAARMAEQGVLSMDGGLAASEIRSLAPRGAPPADPVREAARVRVKALVWEDFEGKGAKARAWLQSNYLIQKWSDGRYEISASYPGYSTFIEGMDRFYPTLEAAKAAAQADYEERILAALTPASVAPDVAVLIKRLEAEEARMQRLWEVASDFRDKHQGTASAFDWNAMRHAISGRDPVLTEAAAAFRAMPADPVAEAARVEWLAKWAHGFVMADRWKGRKLDALPPEQWNKLREETRQFWRDEAAKALRALAQEKPHDR